MEKYLIKICENKQILELCYQWRIILLLIYRLYKSNQYDELLMYKYMYIEVISNVKLLLETNQIVRFPRYVVCEEFKTRFIETFKEYHSGGGSAVPDEVITYLL